ncbi:hypothetical protein CDO52_12300 [Nocardiopsis gilva YIM 90087]|uniref:DUF2567 domain-containing protein n=1 Tax=Nocardiopsis gilva YIM 90087 TaxID=1235441 RepID=A0A223S5R0_9ACTN|nr:hypothetical protein [Nocardiopsis gilva]ASU83462.1 hypothetical protein CDO52_12300 [Nocardiopsis gilva YIM 90087]
MTRRRLVVGAATLGSVAALGIPLGLLWWLITPRPSVTVIDGDGTTAPFPVSQTLFASEGYFAVMMMCAGILCGYGSYLVQYRLCARERVDLRLACLLGLAAGSVLGSLVAWRIGVGLDAGAFARAVAEAEPGDVVTAGLGLRALSALMLWPFVAVLQYGLFDAVSLWRRDLPHQREQDASAPAVDAPRNEPAAH